MKTPPKCYFCKNQIYLGGNKNVCRAFMKGIPDEIFWEGVIHDKPMFDQKNEIVYEFDSYDNMTAKRLMEIDAEIRSKISPITDDKKI